MSIVRTCLILVITCLSARASAQDAAPVATYEPRAVAIAFQGSELYRDDIFKLMDAMQAAGMAQDRRRVEAAQEKTRTLLNQVEEMVFGSRPVDSLLTRIQDALPAIQSGTSSSAVLSAFDDAALSGKKQVDVTEQLVDAFRPDPEARARAIAVFGVPRPARGAKPQRLDLEHRRTDQPMYAGATPLPHERINDEWFIDRTSKQFGGREPASRAWSDYGFQLYQADDNATAMSRFNQAWLLDPDNPEAYWGFASVLHDARRYCEAVPLIDKALSYGKHVQGIESDGGRMHLLCGSSLDEPRRTEERARGVKLFEQALVIDEEPGYVYRKWCTSLRDSGDLDGALAVAERAEKAGFKLPKDLLRELKREAGQR